jgi:hypothetical protein
MSQTRSTSSWAVIAFLMEVGVINAPLLAVLVLVADPSVCGACGVPLLVLVACTWEF